jgi:hypothetical protein
MAYFGPQNIFNESSKTNKKRGRNNKNNNTRRKRQTTQPTPNEKSIYLYINLHGVLDNLNRNNNRKIENSFEKVVFPEKLKHFTKISVGGFGCINFHSQQDSFNRISKVALNLDKILNKESSLYDMFLETQDTRVKKLIDALKGIGKDIKHKKTLLMKLSLYDIENNQNTINFIKKTEKSLDETYKHRKKLLRQYNLIKGKYSKFYSDFEYNKDGENTKTLYNKYFARADSNRKLRPPLQYNTDERLLFNDNINSILSDKNIFILYDSLNLLKMNLDVQSLNEITTQELIDLLVDMGYSHIYIMDFSCNDLQYQYDSNNNNNLSKHKNYNKFQESIHLGSNYAF